MKKILSIIFLIFLSQFSFSQEKTTLKTDCLVIKFIDLDQVYLDSKIAKDVENRLEKFNKVAESKMLEKQNEINIWEQKWISKKPLLSSEQEQFERETILIQQKALVYEQEVQAELIEKQNQLFDTYANYITLVTKNYAEVNSIDIINSYQKGENVWYYKPNLDITKAIILEMNKGYDRVNFKW